MRPVHEFKVNFSQPAPAADAQPASPTAPLTLHEADSTVRNLCLVWEDGRRAFFNYGYLVSGDLDLTDSPNVMLLYFSGQVVTMKGYRLILLFDLVLNHVPKTITAMDPRYDMSGQITHPVVTEITIKDE